MIRNRRVLAAGVLAAAAVLLSACGGAAGGSGEASEGASGEPVVGGAATVLTLSELRGLDPAKNGNNYASNGIFGNALYGTLLVTDPKSGEIQGSMAESFKTADGGATFELKLRNGLVFSDGSPLDATAVKFNWDRMRDPKTGTPYLADASMAASTAVVDATTLLVTMVQPVPNFGHSVVTSSLNWIASPAALAKGPQAFDANPIGAGPYTLKEWRRQDAMEFVRNPKYWDAPKPYLDSLTLRVASDAAQRVNTVISGGADVAIESNWQNVKKATQSGLPTDVQPLSGGTYIAMNQRKAPFDDVRARNAVTAALDVQAINVSVFNGTGELVDSLFSTSSPFRGDIPVAKPDKATAQRLFDELAAEGKPVSFTFTSTGSTEAKAMAEAVQAQLGAFKNVTVDIKIIDAALFPALQTTKDFDAVISSAIFLDPEPRLWTVLRGDSTNNMTGVNDGQLDAELAIGRTATTVEARKAAYEKVQRRLLELNPLIWLTRNSGAAISTKEVGGLTQYGFSSLRPEEIWIKK